MLLINNKMDNLKQLHEIRPEELNLIARKATSDSFAKAIKSSITMVYTEGNALIERQPDGVKIILRKLKRRKQTLTNTFKLK